MCAYFQFKSCFIVVFVKIKKDQESSARWSTKNPSVKIWNAVCVAKMFQIFEIIFYVDNSSHMYINVEIFNSLFIACSRVVDTANKLLTKDSFGGPRCLPDGSFDKLQCVGNRCFCVFAQTGLLSSSTMIDFHTQSLALLPCCKFVGHYKILTKTETM